MKFIFIIIFITFSSCSNIHMMHQRSNFKDNLRRHTYKMGISTNSAEVKISDVRIIKTEQIPDIWPMVAEISTDLKDSHKITHYIRFSSEENFIVEDDAIKKYVAEELKGDIVIYVEAMDVKAYNLYRDNSFKTENIKGFHFFNAFILSKK